MKKTMIIILKIVAVFVTLFMVASTCILACCGIGVMALVFATFNIPADPIICFIAGASLVGVVVIIAWVKFIIYEHKQSR